LQEAWSSFSENVIALFHVNKRCNLKCEHCFMGSTPTSTEQVPFEKVLEVIRDLKELNVKHLAFSGGEPTLRKDLIDILAAAKQAGFVPFLVTNGTRIDDDYASRMRGLVEEVLISLDGPRERHDRFRGVPGTYDKAMNAIQALKHQGIAFSLQFTVTRESYEYMDWVVELGASLGARTIKFEPLFRVGRAEDIDENTLDDREMNDLNVKIQQLHGKYLAKTRVTMGIYDTRLLQAHPCNVYACSGTECHRKATKEPRMLTIMPDGTLLPIDVGIHPAYAIGNVNETRLRDLMVDYIGSPRHEKLVGLCKRVFEKFVVEYPYPSIPWATMLAAESRREENG